MPNARLFALIASNFGRQLAEVAAQHPRHQEIKYSVSFFGLCENHPEYHVRTHSEAYRLRTEAILSEDASLGRSAIGLLDHSMRGSSVQIRALGALIGRRALSGATPLLNPRESRMSVFWNTGASTPSAIIALALLRREEADPNIRSIWSAVGPRASPSPYYTFTNLTRPGPYVQDEARFYLSDLTMPGYSSGLTSHSPEACDQLRRLSQIELATPMNARPRFPIPPSPAHETFGNGPAILYRRLCVGCHDAAGLAIGPAIPFAQPERLRAYIAFKRLIGIDFVSELSQRLQSEYNNPTQLARRMPLGAEALSPSERETLLTYFRRLSAP